MYMNTILAWLLRSLDYWESLAEKGQPRDAAGLARGLDGWCNMLAMYRKEHAPMSHGEREQMREKIKEAADALQHVPNMAKEQREALMGRLAELGDFTQEASV